MAHKIDHNLGEVADKSDLGAQIEALRGEISQIAEKLSTLLTSKASHIGQTLGTKMAEGLEQTASHASEWAAASVEGLNDAKDKARDASAALADAISEEVRRNPVHALTIALGVGLIVGLWSRSR